MTTTPTNLPKWIQDLTSFAADENSSYHSLFKEEKFPAKRILLNEGDVSKRLYFIESGCIRMFFTDTDKDITLQFFFEKSYVASMESFLQNVPSKFGLECLEDVSCYTLSKENYLRLRESSPAFAACFEDFIRRRMFHYMNMLLDYIRLSPERRYQALLKQYPQILQRIAQYHIASYLGITAVSYSRIRNRRTTKD